jgi:hypothetical protein
VTNFGTISGGIGIFAGPGSCWASTPTS